MSRMFLFGLVFLAVNYAVLASSQTVDEATSFLRTNLVNVERSVSNRGLAVKTVSYVIKKTNYDSELWAFEMFITEAHLNMVSENMKFTIHKAKYEFLPRDISIPVILNDNNNILLNCHVSNCISMSGNTKSVSGKDKDKLSKKLDEKMNELENDNPISGRGSHFFLPAKDKLIGQRIVNALNFLLAARGAKKSSF